MACSWERSVEWGCCSWDVPQCAPVVSCEPPFTHLVQVATQSQNGCGSSPDGQLHQQRKQAGRKLHTPLHAAPVPLLLRAALPPLLWALGGCGRHGWLLGVLLQSLLMVLGGGCGHRPPIHGPDAPPIPSLRCRRCGTGKERSWPVDPSPASRPPGRACCLL